VAQPTSYLMDTGFYSGGTETEEWSLLFTSISPPYAKVKKECSYISTLPPMPFSKSKGNYILYFGSFCSRLLIAFLFLKFYIPTLSSLAHCNLLAPNFHMHGIQFLFMTFVAQCLASYSWVNL
jgi:hypothetical protein